MTLAAQKSKRTPTIPPPSGTRPAARASRTTSHVRDAIADLVELVREQGEMLPAVERARFRKQSADAAGEATLALADLEHFVVMGENARQPLASTNLGAVEELGHLADELITCSTAISTFNIPDLSAMIVSLDRSIDRLRKVRRDLHKGA